MWRYSCEDYIASELAEGWGVGGEEGTCVCSTAYNAFLWKGVVIRSTALYGSNAIVVIKLVIWTAGV
jgi:hypothetical protein